MADTPPIAIVNPASASGRTGRRWKRFEPRFRAALPDARVRWTHAPGHATQLAAEALAAGTKLVVSVGGDGTNNEVLGGFVDARGHNRFPQAELGLLAFGTGGDLHRHLGSPSLQRQLAALRKGPSRTVDYGVAHFIDHGGQPRTRAFLNEASVGLSGVVASHVTASRGLLGARATYVLGALRGIAAYVNVPVRVVGIGADARELELTLAAFQNGQYVGGGMWMAPHAKMDDGQLELICGTGLSKPRLLAMLARVFRGQHLGRPGVEQHGVTRATLQPVDADARVLIELDGEQPGRLPATIEIVAGGLRLRAPSSVAERRA